MRVLALLLVLVAIPASAEPVLARMQHRLAAARAARGPAGIAKYREIVGEFVRRKLPADGPEAEVAAEAAFFIAEAKTSASMPTRPQSH